MDVGTSPVSIQTSGPADTTVQAIMGADANMVSGSAGVTNEVDPTDETAVLEQFKRHAAGGVLHRKDWASEAKEMYDFMAGRQWTEDDHRRMEDQNRPMVTFNAMGKFIEVVTGLQINNRQDIRCYPRQIGKAAVNDTATGALAYFRDRCGSEYEETDAGQDVLLTGMGWIEDFYDESEDPDGVVAQERRDPLEMLWDPMARKKNLSDRRFHIRLKRMTYEGYLETFNEEPSGSIGIAGIDPADLDNVINVITQPQDYQGQAVPSESRGRYLVADYQFYLNTSEWHVRARFPNPNQSAADTAETVEATHVFNHKEWLNDVKPKMDEAGIPHTPIRKRVRKYYRCWITADGIKNGVKEIPCFTFHAITGKRDRNKNLWYGLGRNLKDPQRWLNAFFSSIIWQLMVNSKGGVMYEDDAVEDTAQFEESWADPAKPTVVAPGALQAGKIQPKPSGAYPEGMDRLMQFSLEALPAVSGLNAEVLGMSEGQQPGVTEYQRKQGALTIVAWYFDALRRYYQESGRTMLQMIAAFVADGRLIRIVGQEGAQYVPLLRDKLTLDCDIIVDEAPTSTNMQERVWAALKDIIPMALQAGVAIPKEVIQYSPLPDDLKQKWLAQLQGDPQAAAQAQALAQRAALAKITKDEAAGAASQASATLDNTTAQEKVAGFAADQELKQVETVRKAAEAGIMQAGERP